MRVYPSRHTQLSGFRAGLALVLAACACTAMAVNFARAADAAEGDKIGKMPHLEFNVTKHWVKVECESLAVNAPLEFFCCLAGTNEHESVLRSQVRPSDLHAALLAIGLKPGEPMSYSEATKRWSPPHGPPLRISVEFQKDGKTVSYPAYRWLRDVKTKKECKSFSWVFCGSRIMKDNRYAADDTGYIVSIVNFDFVMIDIPEFASSNNDLLEWERNPDLMPEKGTKVWMVIEPTGQETNDPKISSPAAASPSSPPPSTKPATQPDGSDVGQTLSDIQSVKTDEAKVQSMIQYHDRILGPRARALKEAAQAHYEVIESLRKEQQRLITEADLIQRAIDDLEKKYQDLTTPQPSSDSAPVPELPPAPSASSPTK